MILKEREARFHAEDIVRRMEETNHTRMNGSATSNLPNGHSELDNAFDPPVERPATPEPGMTLNDADESPPDSEAAMDDATLVFQSRIDAMFVEMQGMREQLEAYRQRAEKAEAERDADRKTLAELVLQIRQRDEEKQRAAELKSRSPSKNRSRGIETQLVQADEKEEPLTPSTNVTPGGFPVDPSLDDDAAEPPRLSRANTITPSSSTGSLSQPVHDQVLIQSLPYASMIGVVLIGMGLMAYINGWQQQPRLDR
jgi:hypothetical protein